MTMMLSPDLLDRRALALVALVDPFGRALTGPARLTGEGLRTVAKPGGRWALLAAAGLEAHVGTFDAAPTTPARGSIACTIDIKPFDRALAPRRAVVPLPRDPDPAHKSQAGSLFQPIVVTLYPGSTMPIPPTSAGVRVTVRKRGDGRRVANALVRVRSNNGQFSAQAVSDATGEALVIVPNFPLAFTGNGGSVADTLPAKATAVADPDKAVLVADQDLAAARARAALADGNFPDPDALAAAFPAPASGTNVQLSVRAIATADVEWRAP
jgi:hypothetical protein